MANLQRCQFSAFNGYGNNYLSCVLDVKIYLASMGLEKAILEGQDLSQQDKARVMIFLRHHLYEELKAEYLTTNNPLDLWKNLHERYEHYRLVLLSKARYDWMHMRLQHYKTVNEYNSGLFKIASKLKLCGENVTDEDMLEKTFSTFHASNMLLQQHYRERRFKRYSELIACLLLAEENNELLLKNHQSRPTGSTPFPEVNAAEMRKFAPRGNRGRGRRNKHFARDRYIGKNHVVNHQKWNKPQPIKMKGKGKQHVPPKGDSSNNCHRCGRDGHWSRTCCTPKHFVNLFQASIKEKMKELETNFTTFKKLDINGEPSTSTHIGISDFFGDPMEN